LIWIVSNVNSFFSFSCFYHLSPHAQHQLNDDDHSQRGDGFPLANMLAQVSVGAKDLVPVLTAHLYTVCPMAIPSLPHPAPDATEDQVMESLGMLRKKDGEFESFERFLSRTEVSGV